MHNLIHENYIRIKTKSFNYLKQRNLHIKKLVGYTRFSHIRNKGKYSAHENPCILYIFKSQNLFKYYIRLPFFLCLLLSNNTLLLKNCSLRIIWRSSAFYLALLKTSPTRCRSASDALFLSL